MKYFFNCTFLLVLSLAFFSCKKQELEKSQLEVSNNETYGKFKIEDNLMVFPSNEAFVSLCLKLAKMNTKEREAWSIANNFVSQMVAYEWVIEAEEKFDEEYFKGLDGNLDVGELRSLGKPIAYSKTYQDALGSGLIKEFKEKDGSSSFNLNTIDPSVAYVANLEGLVVIDGIIYQYGGQKIKIMPYAGKESIVKLRKLEVTNDSEEAYVFDTRERAVNFFERGNIFLPTSNSVIWYYNSSNERFMHKVYFRSNNFIAGGVSKVHCIYYTQAIGQKKLFGKWKPRNSYKPIKSLGGNWNFHWYRKKVSSPLPATYMSSLAVAPGTGHQSPFYFNYGNENEVTAPLFPSGTWSLPGSYYFYTPVDINSGANWYGAFWGGTSGYTTNYLR